MSTATLPQTPMPRSRQETRDRLQHVHGLIEANRCQWQWIVALEALGLAISIPLAYFWLVVLLDQTLHLPLVGRVLACLGLVVGVVWAVRHVRRRWKGLRLTQDQTALAMERHTHGGVDNRLINAVQLARTQHGDDEDLTDAVVSENLLVLQKIHLEQAAQKQPALLRLALAGVLILVGLGLWWWQPVQFSNAAARILLPLASIDPAYRTTLKVSPGDIETMGDVELTVTIEGDRPEQLVLYRTVGGKRLSQTLAVDGAGPVVHLLRDVMQDTEYSVSGGDFTSPTYRISVPRKLGLARMRATYQYPDYTTLPNKTVEGPSGDLEGLQGTKAEVVYTFDQPVDSVRLLVDRSSVGEAERTQLLRRVMMDLLVGPAPLTPELRAQLANDGQEASPGVALTRRDERTWAGEVVLEKILGYRLEVSPRGKKTVELGPFAVRVGRDQEPRLELSGIERRMEAVLETPLALKAAASDDFGLTQAALCYRRVKIMNPGDENQEPWIELATWNGGNQTSLRQDYELKLTNLPLTEGDKIEVVVRAKDNCPDRKDWTYGPTHELLLGGDGASLQLQYEQILRTEKDLKALALSQDDLIRKTTAWQRKLGGGTDLRWDDPKNIATLHAAVKELGEEQDRLRQAAGKVAREMSVQSGNVRLGLGMLADTEMVRVLRIYDSVAGREGPQAKQTALADARVTLERGGRSLEEMLEQFVRYRGDWELSHMIPFTKMLADRQTKLRDQSRRLATPAQAAVETSQRPSQSKRQKKMHDLVKLIQPAFVGLSDRLKEEDQSLAASFNEGAVVLKSDALRDPLLKAATETEAGRWTEAAALQTNTADQLTQLHEKLRKAQVEATKKALAALKEKAKSDVEAQKELEKLPPGTDELLVKDFPDGIKLADTIRLREVAAGKKKDGKESQGGDFITEKWDDVTQDQIELKKDSGVRQDTDTLTLAKEPGKTPLMPMYKGDKHNAVKPFVQEKYDDLVGKLLDEADELDKKYQSIKLSTNRNNNDPGDIGKVGGSLNSTGAVAATGNQKPPTLESGGVSRTGRQGARAYGMVLDKEGVDRRGRDKALDGMEQAPDQQGTIKNKKSDDPATDFSTGVGGKKVESDDNHFSLHDTGKWKDEFTKRMEKPQAKNYIVERQDGKIDAKVAAQLRDLESKQEQVIVRLKAIKKELRNLYLPTDHLDELAAVLQANLERLKERPDADLFRMQLHTLDRLRGAVRVFAAAGSSFQPSLPRERQVRGRVLDEPGSPTLPGYEEAVKAYYLRLADQ